jgi:uncharacterized protein (TIGR02646 family)
VKRTSKEIEPDALRSYRNAVPHGTWVDLRTDALWRGREAYDECRERSVRDQGGLCAYCEIDIHDNDPLKCRIEHFHPKSDLTAPLNWALDWRNMLGVCNGGSHPYVTAPGFHLEPLVENLSCDARKDQQIQSGALSVSCEGWILNPLQLPAFPCLFKVRMFDGFLEPDSDACATKEPWTGNEHATVAALVQHTIDMLNLNCDRLMRARLVVIRNIEKNKKLQREQGFNAEQGLKNLAQLYFRRRWPQFFTVIRICLGRAAETHLQAAAYQG